jgi:cytochrome c peroxidase
MMKRIAIGLGAATAVVFGAFGVWLPSSSDPKTYAEIAGEAAGAVQGPRFAALLDRWSQTHEARGGDRNVTIQLAGAVTPGHTQAAPVAGAGLARLNVIDGRVDVQVDGSAAGKSYDVWLVDQRPAAGSSASFEPSDSYLNAGTLQPADGSLRLVAELGPAAFTSFQVDAVVVTESGKNPSEQIVYQGHSDLFQTLYTATRSPELFAMSDFVAPDAFPASGRPLIGENVAYAQDVDLEQLRNFGATQDERRQLVNVNRAVVTNQMVAMGARLFIGETFNGNGRTCETCHNFLDNITLSVTDVQLRSDQDALFVSEFNPAFAPRIVNNQMVFLQDNPVAVRVSARMGVFEDGVDKNPLQRAVPHLQALVTSRSPVAPALAQQVPVEIMIPQAAATRFGTFFPGGPVVAPGPGQMMGPLNSVVIGDAAGRIGPAVDNTFSIGLRQGWGGDLGIEPVLNLFGDDVGTVIGAVATLLARTPARVPGTDFRVPTPAEINAIVAFYLSLGRQQIVDLKAFQFSDPRAARGSLIFQNDGVMPVMDAAGQPVAAGKCNACHFSMSSRANPIEFSALCNQIAIGGMLNIDLDAQTAPADPDDIPQCALTNFNFATGVENNTDVADTMSMQMFGVPVQPDGGFGRLPHIDQVCKGGRPGAFGGVAGFPVPGTRIMPGDCQELFNPPVLVEAADTGPFFHDNTATTIEDAIAFYLSDVFAQSPGGQVLSVVTPSPNPNRPININAGDIQQLAAFFRAMNAQNNLRLALDLLTGSQTGGISQQARRQLARVARAEVEDAISVLADGQLSTDVMVQLLGLRNRMNRAVTEGNEGNTTQLINGLTTALNGLVTLQGNPVLQAP